MDFTPVGETVNHRAGVNTKPVQVSDFYPWHIRCRLVEAATCRNVREIDAITDELAQAGLARRRSDESLFPISLKSQRLDDKRSTELAA